MFETGFWPLYWVSSGGWWLYQLIYPHKFSGGQRNYLNCLLALNMLDFSLGFSPLVFPCNGCDPNFTLHNNAYQSENQQTLNTTITHVKSKLSEILNLPSVIPNHNRHHIHKSVYPPFYPLLTKPVSAMPNVISLRSSSDFLSHLVKIS